MAHSKRTVFSCSLNESVLVSCCSDGGRVFQAAGAGGKLHRVPLCSYATGVKLPVYHAEGDTKGFNKAPQAIILQWQW